MRKRIQDDPAVKQIIISSVDRHQSNSDKYMNNSKLSYVLLSQVTWFGAGSDSVEASKACRVAGLKRHSLSGGDPETKGFLKLWPRYLAFPSLILALVSVSKKIPNLD